MDIACDVALTQGKAALKELLDFGGALDSPAYRTRARGASRLRGVRGTASGTMSRRSCGARSRTSSRTSPTSSPAFAAALRAPLLVLVGEQDKPFVRASHAMAEAIPTRAARRDPRRGALAAVRESRRVDRRARGLPRVAARRSRGSRRGGARRAPRGRGAAAARRRRDVHAVGRAPVRALRRRGAGRTCDSSTCATSRPRRSRPRAGPRSRGASVARR